MTVQLVALEDLKPHPRNRRTWDVPEIMGLIVGTGWHGVVTQQESTGYLIAGHGRLEAVRELNALAIDHVENGHDSDDRVFPLCPRCANAPDEFPMVALPADVVDVDDDTAARKVIGDNRAQELAAWDDQALADWLAELQATELGLTGTGWRDEHLEEMVRELSTPPPAPPQEDDPARWEDIPEMRPDVVTVEGDLWQVGPHRLLCGDSTEDAILDRIRNEAPPRCVLTDPPYAIYGSASGVSSSVADDKMVQPFFAAVCRSILRVLPVFGHAYVHCDWRSWATLWQAAKRAELTLKNCLVWDKGRPGLGSMYSQAHEFVAFLVREPAEKAMMSGRPAGQRLVTATSNVLRFSRPFGDDRQHNAAKPVDMLAVLIENSTDPGDAVLDLFVGSGSTLVAAHRTGRVGLGVELEPRWCDVTLARLQRLTGFVPERGGVPVSFLG